MINEKLFRSLLGSWTFNRTIINRLQPGFTGTVVGTATFKTDPEDKNKLHYSEEGIYVPNEHKPSRIKKSFLYSFDSGKQTIAVHNEDGEMYELDFAQDAEDPSSISSTATHKCKADLYTAKYMFFTGDSEERPDKFELTYNVVDNTKERKDYSTMTQFLRA